MAEEEAAPLEEPAADDQVDTIAMPDYRVVSVVHDADNDRMSVSFEDDLDPHHALGLLVHGLWQLLGDLDMGDIDLDQDVEDE